jgi:hypothetical protein
MDAVPTRLSHKITFAFPNPIPGLVQAKMTQELAPIDVIADEPVIIGPPLEGPGWLDGNSCCQVTPHRAAVNPVNGGLHAPERYAIDYVQLDANGTYFTGPIDELSSYRYFGANILAVADGPIVAMRWDLPEQPPGANPSGLSLDEYGGNHIVQDIGNGHYAFYAHLQPDNPMGVKVGQVLHRGSVIALLGNTGNSDSPHLHFHVMDAPSPLGANGLPFRIDSFVYAGRIPTEADLTSRLTNGKPFPIDTTDAGDRTNESPLFLDVMDYPASG